MLLLALCWLLGTNGIFAQADCNTTVSLNPTFTSMGSPLEGPYQPGESITWCLNIDAFNQTNCNWLHGIVPTFGDGWDPNSFFSSGQPKNILSPLIPHTNGFWVWFPDNWVSYKTTSSSKGLGPGDPAGAGWFFQNFAEQSINPFDPNFTRGDGTMCPPANETWEVCFSIQTKELYDCPDVVDCSVGFVTFGDGETGSNPAVGCQFDTRIHYNAILDCCDGAAIDPISDLYVCNGETINVPITSDGGPNTTYSWEAELFNLSGASNGTGNLIQQTLTINTPGFPSFVNYSVVSSIDGCESAVETFRVIISDFNLDLGEDIMLCPGEKVRIGEFPNGGASPYVYTWEHGPVKYRPEVSPSETTTYSVTVTDVFGCTSTDDITVFVGQVGPISGPSDLCGLTSGEYSVPLFQGTSNYVWTVPDDATIVSGQGTSSIQVDWSNSVGGELCVRPTTGCVSGLTDNCITINAGATPDVSEIMGNATPCIFATENYSIESFEPGVDFTWTVTNGIIASGQGTTSIEVSWDSGIAGEVSVYAESGCGDVEKNLSVGPFIATTSDLSGSQSVCPNEIAIYTSTPTEGDPNFFDWTVPQGAIILSGQGTNVISVDWNNSMGGEVWVVSTGACGSSGTNIPVEIFDGAELEIQGPTTVCAGDVITFSLTPDLPIGTTVNWNYPTNFQPTSSPSSPVLTGNWVNDQDGLVSVVVGVCGIPGNFASQIVEASSGMVVDTAFVLCPGVCIDFAGSTLCDAGSYTFSDPGNGSCGEVFNVQLSYLDVSNVIANAGDDTNVGCTVTKILDGSASDYPAGSDIYWTNDNGDIVGSEITLEVSESGYYVLNIYNSLSQCSDTDTVLVLPAAPPVADAGSDKWINCFNNFETQLSAVVNSDWNYEWSGPNGFSSNEARPTVTESGIYALEVTDPTTGCGSGSDQVEVFGGYELSIDFTQSVCNDLDGTATITHEGIPNPEFNWDNGRTGAYIDELAPGNYMATVSSADGNGCTEILSVEVTADLSCKVTIAGNVFDDGESGDCDPADPLLVNVENIPVTIMPLNQTVLTDANGYYEFVVDTGSYVLTAEVPEPYFILCPGFQTLSVDVSDTSAVLVDNYFFLDYLTNFDLTVTAYTSGATAGESQNMQTQYCNYFFQTINGRIQLIHDPLVTFDPVANGADFYDPDTYTASWLYAGLSWFSCEWLNFNVQIPSDLPDGTVIEHTIVGRPILGDLQPGNNVVTITKTVSNSSAPQSNIEINPNIPLAQSLELSVYPNPARNEFIIESASGDSILSVNMRDVMGKLILNKDGLNSQKELMNIPLGTSSGLYLLEIETSNGTEVRKLFIQE